MELGPEIFPAVHRLVVELLLTALLLRKAYDVFKLLVVGDPKPGRPGRRNRGGR